MQVRVEYINDSVDEIGVLKNGTVAPFWYDKEIEMFIVHDNEIKSECMMIPREFVKSIQCYEVED